VRVIDPSPAIARQVRRVMEQRGLLASSGEASQVFYTTSDVAGFVKTLKLLTGAGGDVRPARWDGGRVLRDL
jgi:glutamate racemase